MNCLDRGRRPIYDLGTPSEDQSTGIIRIAVLRNYFNSSPIETFSIRDSFDSYFGGDTGSDSGGLNPDNYSMGDYNFD